VTGVAAAVQRGCRCGLGREGLTAALLTFAEEKECLGCAKAAYLQPFPAPTDSFLNRKINKNV